MARKKRKVVLHGYADRDRYVSEMGFSGYKEYLESDLWESIRKRVLFRDGNKCRLCKKPATAVHHNNYDKRSLAGTNLRHLLSVCHGCHYKMEFDFAPDLPPIKLPAEGVFVKVRRLRAQKRSRPEIGLAHKEKHLKRRGL